MNNRVVSPLSDLAQPAVPPQPSPVSDEEIREFADALRHSPFAMPLTLLLHSHMPLRGLAVAAVDMFGPMLSFILSERAQRILASAIENSDRWQAFLEYLEGRSGT